MKEPVAWFSNADDFAIVDGETQEEAEALWFDQRIDNLREPVRLTRLDQKVPYGDNPYTGLVYPKCISERAFEALRSLFDSCGIFCQADLDGLPFYLFWPTIVLDCLDEANSEITQSASGYRQLIRPRFFSFGAKEPSVYRIKGFETQCVFVNEATVAEFERSELRGMELQTVMGDTPELRRL